MASTIAWTSSGSQIRPSAVLCAAMCGMDSKPTGKLLQHHLKFNTWPHLCSSSAQLKSKNGSKQKANRLDNHSARRPLLVGCCGCLWPFHISFSGEELLETAGRVLAQLYRICDRKWVPVQNWHAPEPILDGFKAAMKDPNADGKLEA